MLATWLTVQKFNFMLKKVIVLSVLTLLIVSCVSKKKLTQAENKLEMRNAEIEKLQKENTLYKTKQASIEEDLVKYQTEIEKLQDNNENTLHLSEKRQLESASTRNKVKRILSQVDDSRLAEAYNFQDSLNIALEENIKISLRNKLGANADFSDDLEVTVHQPMVEIYIGESILLTS